MDDTQKGLEEQVMELKEWVAKHPRVAKDMDDKLLRRFLHSCYYDMQKTQKTVEEFSNLRADTPEIFGDRDPLGKRVKQAFQYVNLAFVPISGNRRLWIFQINDPGFQKFEHVEFLRTVILAFDAWLLEESCLQEADLTLFDAKDISLKIFWKIHLSLQKKLIKYQEEAMPIRIKQMHMVNAPSFMDKLYAILKPFMSKEMSEVIARDDGRRPDGMTLIPWRLGRALVWDATCADTLAASYISATSKQAGAAADVRERSKLHFHTPNSDTLFQYFSKDDLPKDLGGNLDCLQVYNKRIIDLIHKHSDALKNDGLWKTPKK